MAVIFDKSVAFWCHPTIWYYIHHVIYFVSELCKSISGFMCPHQFPSQIKTDCHNITGILLKVKLNTINITPYSLISSKKIMIYLLLFTLGLFILVLYNILPPQCNKGLNVMMFHQGYTCASM